MTNQKTTTLEEMVNFKEIFEDCYLISLISFAASEKEYDLYNGGCYPSITLSLSDIGSDSKDIYSVCSKELERLIKKYGFEKVDFLPEWSDVVDHMTANIIEELENENREDVFFYLSK